MIADISSSLILSPADHFVVRVLTKPIILSLFCSLVIFSLRLLLEKRPATQRLKLFYWSLGYSVPIVLLAFVAGYLTGVSRSPAVGTVVPAVLTFVGALNVYVFGVMKGNQNQNNKIAVGYAVFLFAALYFYGFQTGAYWRTYGLEERLRILSKQEDSVRNFRKNMGLPSDFPAWMLETKDAKD